VTISVGGATDGTLVEGVEEFEENKTGMVGAEIRGTEVTE